MGRFHQLIQCVLLFLGYQYFLLLQLRPSGQWVLLIPDHQLDLVRRNFHLFLVFHLDRLLLSVLLYQLHQFFQ